jgi:hypothetical protein
VLSAATTCAGRATGVSLPDFFWQAVAATSAKQIINNFFTSYLFGLRFSSHCLMLDAGKSIIKQQQATSIERPC